MAGEQYGHQTEADPRFIHPVVNIFASERTPLLSSRAHAHTHNVERGRGRGETTVIVEEQPLSRVLPILATTWIGVVLGALDSTIISTLSGPIASEFDSLSIMSWLATAYFISLAACQPISGRLTDVVGRGPGLVFSNLVFAAGNLICGLSHGPGTMIFGRVVAGIGGGGLMSISTMLCSDLVPLRKRGILQGLGNMSYAAGSMTGGVFGGLFFDSSKLGWRLAFLLMVPPSVLSAILVAFLVKVPPKHSDRSYLSRIDFTGVFLIITALVLLLTGLNAGGNIVPWDHPLPVTTIPLSLVLSVAFYLWEKKKAAYPIIPMDVMANRTVIAACATNFFCTIVAIAFVFYVPLYLEVRGRSTLEAGLLMLPVPLGLSVASFGVGLWMKRTGKYVALTAACLLVQIAGLVVFALFMETIPLWLFILTAAMEAGGYGGMLTTTLLACIAAVEHSQQAVVTSATYLFRAVGGTLAITIPAAVYQNILRSELASRFGSLPGAAEEMERIRNDLGELARLPEGWRDGVIRSFMRAFSGVWLTMLGFAVLGLVSASFMREHKLHATLSRRA